MKKIIIFTHPNGAVEQLKAAIRHAARPNPPVDIELIPDDRAHIPWHYGMHYVHNHDPEELAVFVPYTETRYRIKRYKTKNYDNGPEIELIKRLIDELTRAA